MSNTVQISCVLDNTDPACPLGMEIWLDDQKLFATDHVDTQIKFAHDFVEDDNNHELRFVMQGKTQQHTRVDEHGQITADARLIIRDIAFDEIILGQIFTDLAVYHHDFNGSRQPVEAQFFGEMGCNGTVRLKFTAPIYLWLLEHM